MCHFRFLRIGGSKEASRTHDPTTMTQLALRLGRAFSMGTVWLPADGKNQMGPLLVVMIPGSGTEGKGQQNSIAGRYYTLKVPQLRDITPQQRPALQM